MRKTRLTENCRCYHLISRLAHQALFLNEGEKTRAVELLHRVEEFSGVIVLAYAIMSNHFHIFIYVPEPEEIDDAWCSFAAAAGATRRRGAATPSCTATATGGRFAPATRSRFARRWVKYINMLRPL